MDNHNSPFDTDDNSQQNSSVGVEAESFKIDFKNLKETHPGLYKRIQLMD